MKKLVKSPGFYIVVIFAAIGIWGVFSYSSSTVFIPELKDESVAASHIYVDVPDDDTSFGGVFFDPSSHSGHSSYKRTYDSLQNIKSGIDFKLNGPFNSAFFFGIGAVQEASFVQNLNDTSVMNERQRVVDSLDRLWILMAEATGKKKDSLEKVKEDLLKDSQKKLQHAEDEMRNKIPKLSYVALRGYRLKDSGTRFFLDRNTNNLAYVFRDSTSPRSSKELTYAYYKRKQIPVRYLARTNDVLVPISDQQYSILFACLIGGTVILWTVWMAFFVIGSVIVLFNISRGKPFANRNIRSLKIMAYFAIGYVFANVFSPYLLHQFYSDLIPSEFVLPGLANVLSENLTAIFIAVGLFLLYKAFSKGNKLQQDNFLTI